MQITVGQLTMDFIMEERARELLRDVPLVRPQAVGVLVERVKRYNPGGGPNTKAGKHELRPVPQDQIDRTAGGAAAFPQNLGY